MAKGRELKGRIKSVENTRKITRTLEIVATSKMKRAQDRVVAARPYATSLTEVIANLYTPEPADGLIERCASGEIDAVYVTYSKYNSALSTPPTSQLVLSVTPPERKDAQPDSILMPSAEVILGQLLPSYVRNSVYRALVENE